VQQEFHEILIFFFFLLQIILFFFFVFLNCLDVLISKMNF
jgi:hypothetical protein